MRTKLFTHIIATLFMSASLMGSVAASEFAKPYSSPRVERENIFDFTTKPAARFVGNDQYEITFAVKGFCDVTVAIVNDEGRIVRHLGSGVLGKNAPAPFQKNALSQEIKWNGKDDLGVYPRNANKLKVRVMLGLKPTFDKRLGGTSPHNLPGGAWGVAINEGGAYVFTSYAGGFSHMTIRKFDLNGEYVKTVFPPPANMPLDKLDGMRFIEYEKGKRAVHGNDLYNSTGADGNYLAGVDAHSCQVALSGKRLLFANQGRWKKKKPSTLFSVNTDSSTSLAGLSGRPFAWGGHPHPRMATSPDGKWVYLSNMGDNRSSIPSVARGPVDGSKKATAFLGLSGKPGTDNAHFNGPSGIDCDKEGRIYVSDSKNNRIQIFSPAGKYLKSIKISGPGLIRVHKKTGAIYVQHKGYHKGKSFGRLSKLKSFDNPVEVFHADRIGSTNMALDSWSPKPRLWLNGGIGSYHHGHAVKSYTLKIFEENGNKLQEICDFDGRARKEAGQDFIGRWAGNCFDKVVCDPTREQAYYGNSRIFDLKTGRLVGNFKPGRKVRFDDMAFDKHGFMHMHFNPCFFGQGIGRMDPGQVTKDKRTYTYPELPYDYGIAKHGWSGILPVFDQNGAKGFQDGLGVNMLGDVAEECNIYYVPKMEEEGFNLAAAGVQAKQKAGIYVDSGNRMISYAKYMGRIRAKQKRGEVIYSIKRRPGIALSGGTIWTFDRHGELLKECAVIAGDLINGVQMDEDRSLYFVNSRPKIVGDKSFLYGKGGTLGNSKGRQHPFTGTVIKTKPDALCRVLFRNAAIPMDPLPQREPDIMALDFMVEAKIGKGAGCWVDGAEWLYAGASPITSTGCSCPRQHLGLDWYKRTFVPEVYRHSIGILDTNGNLILHVGQYGNIDSGMGAKSLVPVKGDGIGMMISRFISATDNYLVYGDWSERIMVLKLGYHAEETVEIKTE